MMDDLPTKKSLGQHWLRDEESLKEIVKEANISKEDTVLEIGPGLGTLTKHLVTHSKKVIAIEFDEVLSNRLKSEIPNLNLVVRHQDILKYDLNQLPLDYKVVANIPYYITGSILRLFTDSTNLPTQMTLLVQKEVAERIAAKPGEMSVLAVAAQLEYEVKLGKVIEAEKFTPPPQVDSQVIILKKRHKPLFLYLDKKSYMRVVKAGFSARRKKLRSSLSAGLVMEKNDVDEILKKSKISGDLRAQELSLTDWYKIYNVLML
jgi:16S rRNA (adenine1518-N6/adenine1519-N6)-dimethyltransferase